MDERSIVCKADEVLRLLAGETVEIRRCVNMRDVGFIGAGGEGGADWNDPACWGYLADDGVEYVLDQTIASTPHQKPIRCPFGVAGARRWIKETWSPVERSADLIDGILYKADGLFVPIANTREASELWVIAANNDHSGRWRSPVHMPRWASRLVVDIAAVRCERSADGQRWEWIVVAKKVVLS